MLQKVEQVEATFISSNFKSEWIQTSKQDDDVSVKLYFHLRESQNSERSSKATKINENYTESTQHKVLLNKLWNQLNSKQSRKVTIAKSIAIGVHTGGHSVTLLIFDL
ncbi:GPI mannosyltransferase 2 [Trichinella spiralis]|uniref:GPI mannosyltransferase 2 n=1 Tax=Trichinella spiralis TaxID=6334 RepID=UPI0001EFC952|nr:GPI mannosyltransferase 2 [Trichinella spiralis]